MKLEAFIPFIFGIQLSCCRADSDANIDTPKMEGRVNSFIDVYFGVGCFWHIQHGFVDAERDILDRSDTELTSRAGYAGGASTDDKGRVCYHNSENIADYGELGYAEVVALTIPESSIEQFTSVYFGFFVNGDRSDQGDRGSEYRSVIGLPGGAKNAAFTVLEHAAKSHGLSVEVGQGNDPDTLGKNMVYVMDTDQFPFHQAEIYHQFHDDFKGPAYGKEYNNLAMRETEDGKLYQTSCPGLSEMRSSFDLGLVYRLFFIGCVMLIIVAFGHWKNRKGKRYVELNSVQEDPERRFDVQIT